MCDNRVKALYLRQLLDELRQWIAAWRAEKSAIGGKIVSGGAFEGKGPA